MSSDLKMSAKKRNYLDFPVGFLEGSGLSSTSRLYRKFISICIFLPITFFLVYLVVRKFWDEKRDILLIAEVFESLTTCAHLLSRKYVMFVHGNLIKEVIKDREACFWDYNMFGVEYGGTLQKKMIICTRIIKIVVSGGVVTVILFCLTTIFDEKKVVPLICWTPDDKLLTGLIYAIEVLVMLEIMYVLLSIDSFYLLICTDLRIQFILLQDMIKTVKFGEGSNQKALTKIIQCTQHHEFLLRSPSFGDSVKSICYLVGMLFQVGLYFIITSNIEIEAENLSGEIYNINWEATDSLKVRKHILFMLMKSQEPLSITGGGMLHVNRNEYVVLCRLAYSIATILGGMT
ncbi:odorant receptor 43a-like [Tenebrio molitor]|uniref:odorant receptor 43a-like n=1 Tax=Tenebrio molitor TaxID=7067 RepID=UPI0036246E86